MSRRKQDTVSLQVPSETLPELDKVIEHVKQQTGITITHAQAVSYVVNYFVRGQDTRSQEGEDNKRLRAANLANAASR